jgi:signal-transduction protein with cAMP-binding, CBS, and nucleotidyltransferase domain
LLVREVPLIKALSRTERQKVLTQIEVKVFRDKEFIIRQGDIGDYFFIIYGGSVRVVEERSFGFGEPTQSVTLVTLREGHFFGEMSLVTNEPRVASVISVGNTICLCLSKSVFRR